MTINLLNLEATSTTATTTGGQYRGLIALASDGGENMPNANTGTENVGTALKVGDYWVASQDGILADSATGQTAVTKGDTLRIIENPPTLVDHVVVNSGAPSTGPAGPTGAAGADGDDAYEVWLRSNTGTEAEFLASLIGPQGNPGNHGIDGEDGVGGTNGLDGESAYDHWLGEGNSGSVADFLADLSGADGAAGVDGADGADGADGSDGDDAYEVWLRTNAGTEADFLASLVGAQGPAGDQGPAGAAGADGANGESAGQYRGHYTPPGVAGVGLPTSGSGTVNVGEAQRVGDIYVIAAGGEINDGTNPPVEVSTGDLVFVKTAPVTNIAHIDVVKTSVVYKALFAAATTKEPALDDEVLFNDTSAGDQTNAGKMTLTKLIELVNSVDNTFSESEIAAITAAVGERRPTKIARYITTAAIPSGETFATAGTHASVTLLPGSDTTFSLPATEAEYHDNPDIKVFVGGLLANKVLNTDTFEIAGAGDLTHMTASWISTAAITFQQEVPADTIIEIHYHNAPASTTVAPPPPPSAITAQMLSSPEVDVAGIVEGRPATYEVLTNDGGGHAEFRDSTLVYTSTIESGPVNLTYRATEGVTTTDGALQIILTDQFTLADAQTLVRPDIDNKKALTSKFDDSTGQGQTAVYETSYLNLGLRNLFQGTGDRQYFDDFKEFVDDAIAAATHSYTAGGTGTTPVSGVPHEDYGANTGTDYYSAWQDPTTLFPNVKATDQWAMTALLFLYDVITQKGEASTLTAADRTWAEDTAYAWIAKNVIEFNRTRYGADGAFIVFTAWSAKNKTRADTGFSREWGYWCSNIGVAACALTIDQAIRDHLSLGDHSYVAVQTAVATTADWVTNHGFPVQFPREDLWWDWFKERVVYDADDRATWDVNNNNMNNFAGSQPTGWGFTGEHQAPDIGHGFGRYGYWAWLKVYLGQDLPEARAILEGFDKQWSEVCVLPPTYETPDGDHAGEVASGIQVSNYIDGVDTPFRAQTTANNSTAGTGSFSYYSQFGFTRAESRAALAQLYRNGSNYYGPGDNERTGTWERNSVKSDYTVSANSSAYGGFCLLGNILAAVNQPL